MDTPLYAVLLLFVLAPLSRGEIEPVRIPYRNVVDGTDAPQGRFPYACSVRNDPDDHFVCTAVLIHRRVVLTAGHCINYPYSGVTDSSLVVYCGNLYRDDPDPDMIFNSEARLFPCWGEESDYSCDIGVLVLDKAADLPLPQLPSQDDEVPPDVDFTVLGWGINDYWDWEESDCLQMADNYRLCEQPPVDEEVGTLCVESPEQTICDGDSGGPLVIPDAPNGEIDGGNPSDDKLVGLHSSSYIKECYASMPHVSTKVSTYMDRIQEIIDEIEVAEATIG